MSGSVLLVDDDLRVLEALRRSLTGMGYQVSEATTGGAALEEFVRYRPDAVVLDLGLPDLDGLEVLEHLRAHEATVLILTGHGDVGTAVRAMQLGAENFLLKPVDSPHLGAAVARAVEKSRLRREVRAYRASAAAGDVDPLEGLGTSPLMTELAHKVRLLAESDRTTVLLTGESGTGKGWVARALHRLGPRRDAPFVEVNSAGLTATFLSSELFGHEKGAFTDAREAREGLFELAHRGVLFLDEVGDLAPELQPKLLNVLEHQTFRRLGGSREIRVDVRLVAATNHDLEAAVAEGSFREDLYYRLNVTPLHLPALRERPPEDRVALLHRIHRELLRDLRRGPAAIDPEALARLVAHPWPGNIREMRNVLERALIFGQGEETLLPRHLPPEMRAQAHGRTDIPYHPESLAEVERAHIERVLRHHAGNRTRAARDLGIARATLISKIRRYGLDA
ncbi:MAG: sigma-54 dependent transcriptional regulator [Longimicrobiales bacterium]|nr:sigma-54 dependent transcriptional regulator [Longimicrobiales bacterium]